MDAASTGAEKTIAECMGMNTKISRDAKLLMASDMIYSLTSVFIKTFLVAYFLTITNESMGKIALYYILVYAVQCSGNVLMGNIVKKRPSRCKQILSLGIVIKAVFILAIGLLAEKIATYYVVIALFYGAGESLYWCVHELIYIDVTTNENRKRYMSINRILGKIVSVVSPLLLGTSIQRYSFSKIAGYVFVLTVIQILITLFIRTTIQDQERETYSLKGFFAYLKEHKLHKIRTYSLSAIAYGMVESSVDTLITIIIMMTFKTSFSLGVLATVFNFCSMLSLMLYNKFYTRKRAGLVLTLCPILLVLGSSGCCSTLTRER